MLKSQKHTIRIGEIRKRLGELSDVDGDLSDDQQGEYDGLRAELRSADTKLAAALLSEQEDADASEAEHGEPLTSEQREYREVLGNARIMDVVNNAINGTQVVGATRDLQSLHGLDEHHQLPIDLLFDPDDDDPAVREFRVNTLQANPGDLDQSVKAARFPIFKSEISDFLAIRRSTTGPGRVVWPTWTAPTAGPTAVTGSTPVADTDWTMSQTPVDESRLQRSFVWSRSDAARYAGLETDLRRLLRDSMMDGMDAQAATAITGVGTAPTAASDQATFANYKAAAFDALDDEYAKSLTDVRLLVGQETMNHMSSRYESNNNRENALDWLMGHVGGVRYSGRIAAKDTTDKDQETIRIKAGGGPHAEQVVWNSMELIRDVYTGSGKGDIKLTAVTMAGVVVVRTAPYSRLSFKLEA